MFDYLRVACLLLALKCAFAQDSLYRFTSGVSDPAPVPGQPFTLTWTGGSPDGTVYIILNYLFPFDPKQDIVYGTTDILSNAPNNGSWTYNVPINIQAGRYTFSIAVNPLQKTDTTGIFTILPSQTGEPPPGSPATTTINTASTWSYNGCGLIPLPDYTYTGYQAPCLITTDGRIETIFPIVPPELSSSFYGPDALRTIDHFASVVPTQNGFPSSSSSSNSAGTVSTSSLPENTAIASGIYAQALQCSITVSPVTMQIVVQDTTTVFSSVECAPPGPQTGSRSPNNFVGICHSSGYATFSVSGTSSVCCPTGWNTTPFADSNLYCFTSAELDVKRDLLGGRQISAETTATATTTNPSHLTSITGLAFTRAGVVQNPSQTTSAGSNTAPAANSATSKNGAQSLSTCTWYMRDAMAVAGALLLIQSYFI